MNTIDVNTAADAVLWLAVKQNDKTAFRTLFDRYGGSLFKSADAMLKDREASETIVHDIFLNLWMKRDQLNIQHFRNYIITATRYHVYKAMQARKALHELPGELEGMSAFTANGAEEKLSEQTVRELLRHHANALPKRCREIFLMSREQQLSNQEIAERLNISKRSVENQITYALQHLRVHLKQYSLLAVLLFDL